MSRYTTAREDTQPLILLHQCSPHGVSIRLLESCGITQELNLKPRDFNNWSGTYLITSFTASTTRPKLGPQVQHFMTRMYPRMPHLWDLIREKLRTIIDTSRISRWALRSVESSPFVHALKQSTPISSEMMETLYVTHVIAALAHQAGDWFKQTWTISFRPATIDFAAERTSEEDDGEMLTLYQQWLRSGDQQWALQQQPRQLDPTRTNMVAADYRKVREHKQQLAQQGIKVPFKQLMLEYAAKHGLEP